jgi:biopolymer transport protein ExbB
MWLMVLAGMLVCGSAMAAPIAEASEATRESLLSLLKKGGPVMIPLAIGSVLALAIAIERSISLRKTRIIPEGFMENLVSRWGTDANVASTIAYCDEVGGPVGHVFKSGMLRMEEGKAAVEKAIEDSGCREADKMKRSLRGLSIIATVSPLLGLLGTVYGMISAFQTATAVGMGKADVLAKGIYEALVTTATGLTIAIPVLLVFQFLSTKVDGIVDELDAMGIEFMLSCIREAHKDGS